MSYRFLISLGFIVALLLVGVVLYPHLPDRMAIHWNASGEVDGYASKPFAVFLFPLAAFALWCLFLVIPRIDPLRKNIEQFRGYYEWFVVFMTFFLTVIGVFVFLWNMGVEMSISALSSGVAESFSEKQGHITLLHNRVVSVLVGCLFFYIGILCKYAKRNWFVGIRTPWTLSDDEVWERTHRVGSILFRISGVVALLGALFPKLAIWFIMFPPTVVAVFVVVYSYVVYQQFH